MKTYSKLKAGVAPAALGLAMIAMPAFAQDAASKPQAAAADDTPQQQIVVTGSLIRNPNLVSANPVNVTTSEEIELRQSNVAEEVLREIPGVVPNIGSSVNNGNGGSSYVDLRGLGSTRNIVLLDGQRLVPADLNGRVDLNNIPLALINRVDVLTGSAVTTYGADAITGVVNFVTKKNFAGVDLSLGEAINQKGDGNTARADLTVGGNFADGKGNAVLSIGYQKSDPVYQGDRDYSQFNIDSFSGAGGGSGTTVPARFSINGGNRQINPTTGALQSGFNAFNFNPFNIFQTPFKRYNIFAQANYEISDSIEVYTRALFSKNRVDTIIAPSGVFASLVTIPFSNPYLPTAARMQFCAGNTAATFSAASPLTLAQCNAAATATSVSDPNYKTFNTVLRRRFVETGTRNSDFETTVFDYELGTKGHITSSIDFDIHGAYGESNNTQTQTGYVLTSRVRDALLATNKTSCLSALTGGNAACVPVNVFGDTGSIPASQYNYLLSPSTVTVKTSLAQVHAQVTGDVGLAFPGAKNKIGFAVGTEYRRYNASQTSDTLSQTPGELGGAGGAQPIFNGTYDVWEGFGELVVPLIEDAPLFHNLTVEGGVRYSAYTVGDGHKNNATTYKGGLTWEPIVGLKFRGNYAHAVRAPNIAELFTPNTVGLTSLLTDPCAGAQTAAQVTLTNKLNPKLSDPNFVNVCRAQGAPANTIGQIANPTATQANATFGGNTALKPEKANTYTIGMVFQPSFIRRFSISVDYYHIKVTNEIGTATTGDVIANCFGAVSAASATSIACTSIRRDPALGGLDGDVATTFGLPLVLTNQGTLATDGIDVSANWSVPTGFGKYTMSFNGNYTAHSKFQASATSLNRECVGLYSANCSFTGSIQPKYQWSLRNTLTYKKVDLSLLWRHISGNKYEPQSVLDNGGTLPGSICANDGTSPFCGALPAGTGPVAGQKVDFGKIPAANYFDLAARFDVNEHFTMTVSVANLLDKKPPLTGASLGTTAFNSGNTYPSTYDTLGRRFSVSAHVKF